MCWHDVFVGDMELFGEACLAVHDVRVRNEQVLVSLFHPGEKLAYLEGSILIDFEDDSKILLSDRTLDFWRIASISPFVDYVADDDDY